MSEFAEKTLKALEAAIHGRASRSMLSMSFGGKAIGMMSLTEQLDVRDRLLREINATARTKACKSPFTTIKVRIDG